MHNHLLLFFFSLSLLTIPIHAQPHGFAFKVTGGGSSPPIYPSSLSELVSYLEDNEQRVIVINKEFNFIGSMGQKTEMGCRPSSNTCPDNGGQDAINPPFNWCGDYPKVEVTYDVSSINFINVKGNKTLKGEGSGAVIKGRGIKVVGDNVIIQNIHFTDLNPQYIWGGDALAVYGSDLLWVDHCKFSLIGRQFFVINGPARGQGRITLSYNDFDGKTPYSATCNGHHYWVMYITNVGYHITFLRNYVHQTSGRGPKLGLDGVTNNFIMHAVNNYYYDVSGHAFDTALNDGITLIEGNYFEAVKTPRLQEDNSQAYAPITLNNDCDAFIGRDCQPNQLLGSGALRGDTNEGLSKLKGVARKIQALDPKYAKVLVLNNAGVGKI